MAEGPAPADPAGGVSWAKACPGRTRLPSTASTSANVRDIRPSGSFNKDVSRVFPWARRSTSLGSAVIWRISSALNIDISAGTTPATKRDLTLDELETVSAGGAHKSGGNTGSGQTFLVFRFKLVAVKT